MSTEPTDVNFKDEPKIHQTKPPKGVKTPTARLGIAIKIGMGIVVNRIPSLTRLDSSV